MKKILILVMFLLGLGVYANANNEVDLSKMSKKHQWLKIKWKQLVTYIWSIGMWLIIALWEKIQLFKNLLIN